MLASLAAPALQSRHAVQVNSAVAEPLSPSAVVAAADGRTLFVACAMKRYGVRDERATAQEIRDVYATERQYRESLWYQPKWKDKAGH
jgi:hypothetical protein